MRLTRIAFLSAMLLSLPLVFASSASALDLCDEAQCQPADAEQNTPYEFKFEAEEGCPPYRFSYLNGTLPRGLTVTQDGKLTGTPTEAGRFDFWVGLDDNGGPSNPFCQIPSSQSQGHFFIRVMPDLVVTTETLPIGRPGTPYSVQLQFSNPESGWDVIWDVKQGSLPQGLALSPAGVISGTPSAAGVSTFLVRAREPFRRFGERQLTLTVAPALEASAAVGPGEVGLRYVGAARATGGLPPFTWSTTSGTLPGGLSLDPATGAISGIPRDAGSFAMTFAVADAAGQNTTVAASMRIAQRLSIRTTRLPRATSGVAYRTRFTSTGGLTPITWRIVRGALPRGIKLDRRTGVLTGVARARGSFPVTVQAADRLGATSKRTFALRVAA